MSLDRTPPIQTLEVLVTANEAFPALERLFLSAKREILAGFRIFDLETRLRSDEAREIGTTWFDLFQHTLERGVSITLMLSDFDPIAGTRYHRKSWQSAQQLIAAQEVSGKGKLDYRIAMHPAKAGLFPRIMLWSKARKKLKDSSHDEYTPGLPRSPDSFYDLSPVTHHQKLAVFDQTTLYIGGLDLDERRFDTPTHDQPAHETWQDVQVIVTGTVASAAHRHLASLDQTVAGKAPPPKSDGFLRTVSAKRSFAPFHLSPRTVVNEIEEAHLAAISRSKRLIYLETQYFRHQPLADALAEAAQREPDLHLLVVLPAAPEDVAFEGSNGKDAKLGEGLQADAVATVRKAFGERVLFCSPARPVPTSQNGDRSSLNDAPIIYVHSKVSIFDHSEAIISSANLNGRSFRWDTEAGVHVTDPNQVSKISQRMSEHWMPHLPTIHEVDPGTVVAAWRDDVEKNSKRRPDARSSFLLPYDEREAAVFGEKVPGLPNELV